MSATRILVSIDTEEDNWTPTREGIAVENVRALPEVDDFLNGLGLRPTYFVNYPVVSEPWAADILGGIREKGGAEIGAHLHPWNTPPQDEAFLPRNTMCHNLPLELQQAKIETLRDAIHKGVGERPVSFRAGRFGLGRETVRALIDTGFRVDSSVTPFIDWRRFDEGPDFSPAPLDCYRLDGEGDPRVAVADGPLVEVPVSSGFTRAPFEWRSRLHHWINQPGLARLKANGVARRLGVSLAIGNLEHEAFDDVLAMSRSLLEQGVRHLHLFWHSPSHAIGNSPFVRTEDDRQALRRSIERWVEEIRKLGPVEPVTVTEAAEALAPPVSA